MGYLLIFWGICGATAAYLYRQRGRSWMVGFAGGFLWGPIGILLALLSPAVTIRCPHCKGKNRPGARFCRECGREVPPESRQAPPPATAWKGPIILGLVLMTLIVLFFGIFTLMLMSM